MKDFLPTDYEVPSSSTNYMKFEQGANKILILSSPILGWLYWIDEEGKRKPLRRRMNKPFSTIEVTEPDNIKHFWAMVVYNYNKEEIQILELTQSSIQKTLKALAKDEDWGSPVQKYDIVITKSGEKKETRYEILPKPAKKIDPGVIKAFDDMKINLEALFDGGDPFNAEKKSEEVANKAVNAGV